MRRGEATVVTMVFMRQIILRFPHIMPIYWTSTLSLFLFEPYFWANTPGPEFRENSRERAARSPTNRSQRFDTPSPGAHTCRAGHMSVVTISAHAHASTHSDEALRQTSSSEAHHRSANEKQQHINRTGL